MKYRPLGETGLSVSEIGHGGWGLGGIQWRGSSDRESLDSLHRAFELGINLVDTALAYGEGHSERLIGRAIRDFREPVSIATKVPPMDRVWPATAHAPIQDVFPASYVMEATETSLRNLGVERIDLQQLHVWNAAWTDQDEWQRTFEKLKQSGKVRLVGVSLTEHDPDSGLKLVETDAVDVLQVLYNVFDPSAASQLFPLAQDRGIGILARVPLDEDGLTGSVTEETVFEGDEFRASYFRGDRRKQVAERVACLQEELAGFPAGIPEVAIRFCLSHPAVSSVIPGMHRRRHVESNVRAAEAGPLPLEILNIVKEHAWKRNFYL